MNAPDRTDPYATTRNDLLAAFDGMRDTQVSESDGRGKDAPIAASIPNVAPAEMASAASDSLKKYRWSRYLEYLGKPYLANELLTGEAYWVFSDDTEAMCNRLEEIADARLEATDLSPTQRAEIEAAAMAMDAIRADYKINED